MCLVKRVTNSVIKLVDASLIRGEVGVNCFADLHPEKYWKNKKYYKLIVENCRLVRYVVLDVELCSSPFSVVGEERRPSKTQNGTDNNGVYEIDCVNKDANQTGDVEEEHPEEKERPLYMGPQSGVEKYALADVEVARESDLGTIDETFHLTARCCAC